MKTAKRLSSIEYLDGVTLKHTIAGPQFPTDTLDRHGIAPTSPLDLLARLGAGTCLTLQGDTAKAKAAYQDLFAA
jgi:hypothetical protein